MKPISPARAFAVILIFTSGFVSHMLYQRWSSPAPHRPAEPPIVTAEGQAHPVVFAPLSPPARPVAEAPVLQAREVDSIRALAGQQARIRGRIFRVGHAAKSNTHFLNFGPARGALTAVIFASALASFEAQQLSPQHLAGREVEIVGEIKDHPQFGVEVILEHPRQIKVLQ